MSTWIVQRVDDGRFYTGLVSAKWSSFVSAAWGFVSKDAAVDDVLEHFPAPLKSFYFLELPKAKRRGAWSPTDREHARPGRPAAMHQPPGRPVREVLAQIREERRAKK